MEEEEKAGFVIGVDSLPTASSFISPCPFSLLAFSSAQPTRTSCQIPMYFARRNYFCSAESWTISIRVDKGRIMGMMAKKVFLADAFEKCTVFVCMLVRRPPGC